MPTTATAPESNGFDLGVDPEEAFYEVAFHEPTVCSRCFSLIRERDTYRPDATQGVSKYAPEERLRRAFDGTKGYRTIDVNAYGYRPIHEPRTFCGECGSQSGQADPDDLPRRLAILFAANLANRLHEAGVGVNPDELKRAVGLLKSKEELHGCDMEIFKRATKIVVRRSRRR